MDVGPQPGKVEANKRKQQAPTGPTASVVPQPCKVEPNNNKKQPTNQQTTSTHRTSKQCMYLQR